MKHLAPQFEIPGAEAVFNLAGETRREEPPQPRAVIKPDPTPDLFTTTEETKKRDACAQRYYKSREQWAQVANEITQAEKQRVKI